jgi:hypothetical protein
VLDNSAVESFTGIDRGNPNDARINADHTFALRIGNVLCDDQMKADVRCQMSDVRMWRGSTDI